MSVLPLNLNLPLDRFAHPDPIRVSEVEGRREGGRWRRTALPERFIRAVVLVPDVETLEFLSAGDAPEGAITLMTRAELYFTDLRNDGDGEHVEGRQSFVHYRGRSFRVAGDGFTLGNTVYNTYHCLRHLEEEEA